MKNKKGFTMIELLGVIVILGIILVIAIPKITETIKNYRISNFENQKELILKAADKYIEVNRIKNGIVTYKELIDEGLLKNGIVDENGKPLIPEGTTINTKTKKITYSTDTEDKSGTILSYKANGLPLKDYKIYGNSTQETRSGKNLANISNLTNARSTYGENAITNIDTSTGSFTINYRQFAQTEFKLKDLAPNLEAGKTYYLFGNSAAQLKYIYLYGASQAWTYNTSKTITQEMIDGGIDIYGMTTEPYECTISNFMITETNDNNYEPYGVMPSPEFPSEVVSLGKESNEIEVVSSGKNLFNIDEFISLSGNSTYYSKDANGHLIQIAPDYRTKESITKFIPLSAGKYNISIDATKIVIYAGDLQFNDVKTFSVSEPCLVGFKIYSTAGTDLGEVQIEKGTDSTSYELYQTPITTTIDLSGHDPLRKIGNVADYIDYKNGKIIRNIGKKVFDGTESLGSTGDQFSGYFTTAYGLFSKQHDEFNKFLTTHFENRQLVSKKTNCAWIGGSYNRFIYFRINQSIATNSTELLSYFAQQNTNGTPVTIYYELETPDDSETINLPQIPTFNGTTNISVEGASNVEGTFYN